MQKILIADDEAHIRRLVCDFLRREGYEPLEAEDGELTAIRCRPAAGGDEFIRKLDGLFVAIGLIPDNKDFADIAKLDEWGYFAAGEDCRTATPGVFIAGDCRAKRIRQITTAAADGSVAALAACTYLDEETTS